METPSAGMIGMAPKATPEKSRIATRSRLVTRRPRAFAASCLEAEIFAGTQRRFRTRIAREEPEKIEGARHPRRSNRSPLGERWE